MDRTAPFLARGRGNRAVLLLPNLSQANHVKRLFLSRYPALGGFFDESVLTFTSLAERVGPERQIGEILSGAGRDRILATALERTGDGPFRAMGRYPGFRRAALALISELKQNGRPAAVILGRLDDLARRREGAARTRLEAFRDLFAAYEAVREGEGRLDHEDFLREARDVLVGGSPAPSLEFFAADGFQNFTTLEREILLALADRSRETVVTLPFDPAGEGREDGPFRVARETADFLLARGFRREVLTENHRARHPGLADLEAALCRRTAPAASGAVRVLEGADPEDEADRVARCALRLLRGEEGPARKAREIVIITRNAAPHARRFRRAFRRHGVPLRVEAPEDLSHHPYLRSARNLLRLLSGEFTGERLLAFFRCDHVPGVSPAAADRLEDEVFAGEAPEGAEGWAAALRPRHAVAAELVEALAGFELEPTTASVGEALSRFLVPLWERDLSDPDRVRAEAAAHRALHRALEELSEAPGPAPADLSAFLDRLEEALEAAAPPADRRLEAVSLIDAREARQWEAPVVFVCSLLAGEFPANLREDIFVDDEGRREANREGGLALKERRLLQDEERYLFYVALTRARDRLYLTYPVTDGSGRESSRSLYLEEVLSGLAGEAGEELVSRRRLSDVLPREEEVDGARDLHDRALLGLARAYRPGTEEETRARRAAALHDLLVGGEEPDAAYREAARKGIRFLGPPPATLRGPLTGGAPLPAPRRHSPSALEDFVQCPFLHFAKRILRLGPARPDEAARRVLGEIAHEALRLAFTEVAEGRPPPGPEAAGELLGRALAGIPLPAPLGLRGDRALRELKASLARVLERERARLGGSAFRPARLEAPFGIEEDGIRIEGRIDRVDTSPAGKGLVIDYKYSRRGFDGKRLREIEEGGHLQLPIYLLALERSFGLKPAGAWLYPLLGPGPGGFVLPGEESPAGGAESLGEEELSGLLDRTLERIRELDRRIGSGDIAVAPRDPSRCSRCDFADLCRVEVWRLAEET